MTISTTTSTNSSIDNNTTTVTPAAVDIDTKKKKTTKDTIVNDDNNEDDHDNTSTTSVTSTSNEDGIPEEFICPLTLELYKNPVMTRWGHTYERDAIIEWLHTHDECPLTRNSMTLRDIIPNRVLREQIQTWKSKQKQATTKGKGKSKPKKKTKRVVVPPQEAVEEDITESCTSEGTETFEVDEYVDDEDDPTDDLVFYLPVKSDKTILKVLKKSNDPHAKGIFQQIYDLRQARKQARAERRREQEAQEAYEELLSRRNRNRRGRGHGHGSRRSSSGRTTSQSRRSTTDERAV